MEKPIFESTTERTKRQYIKRAIQSEKVKCNGNLILSGNSLLGKKYTCDNCKQDTIYKEIYEFTREEPFPNCEAMINII